MISSFYSISYMRCSNFEGDTNNRCECTADRPDFFAFEIFIWSVILRKRRVAMHFLKKQKVLRIYSPVNIIFFSGTLKTDLHIYADKDTLRNPWYFA